MIGLWLALVACGGAPESGARSLGTVAVGSPWKELGAPFGDGNPWYCAPDVCHFVYDGGQAEVLGAPYATAVEAAGWVPRRTDQGRDRWTTVYDRGGETLTVDVGRADFSGKVPGGMQVTLAVAPRE